MSETNSPEATERTSWVVRLLGYGILCVGLPILAFVLVEGGASVLIFGRDATAARRPIAESISTEYDAELGWVARKNFRARDFYGPGAHLSTNAQGFRGERPVPAEVAPGTRRIVCSGDSFTLGYGVADDETWCARLGGGSVETVNMGQGGYGIDQAWLWYARDGRTLAHHVHILSFVPDDFIRTARHRFLDYAKPLFRSVGDSLQLTNVPVPRDGSTSWMTRHQAEVRGLRFMQLLERLRDDGQPVRAQARQRLLDDAELQGVLTGIVRRMRDENRSRQSVPILLFFPVKGDYMSDGSRRWRTMMREVADSLGVAFIDLTPAFRDVPPLSVDSLFIQGSTFLGADGHYSVRGNQWVVEQLRPRLDALVPGLGLVGAAPMAGAAASPPVRP